MNTYTNMTKIDSSILRKAFYGHESLILKSLKLSDFPDIAKFFKRYTQNEFLNSIDVFIMKGTIHTNGQPAYALFFDGDEQQKDVELEVNGKVFVETVVPDSPIILVSEDVVTNSLLLDTTLVHEISHFVDGMPQGEEIAQRLEYIFLTTVHMLSKEEALNFLKSKYD